jgi:hypothetical protein
MVLTIIHYYLIGAAPDKGHPVMRKPSTFTLLWPLSAIQ